MGGAWWHRGRRGRGRSRARPGRGSGGRHRRGGDAAHSGVHVVVRRRAWRGVAGRAGGAAGTFWLTWLPGGFGRRATESSPDARFFTLQLESFLGADARTRPQHGLLT